MLRSVETRTTPFLGFAGEKLRGRPCDTSSSSGTTSSGQVLFLVMPLPRTTGRI
uniref:Uncharacterized protein n=1 Tax=Rhizophora mucronata TaxID=61149 RepID=A0A2P2N9R6_RHIMU